MNAKSIMGEKFPTKTFEDIKHLTLKLQNEFSSENSAENVKWFLLEDYYSKFLLQKDFNRTFTASYVAILSKLLDCLEPNLFTEKCQESLFDNIFLQGIHHEAFLILSHRLGNTEGYAQQKIIDLLLKFARGSSFESMCMHQCVNSKDWDLKFVSSSKFWDGLLTAIISIPERIANRCKGKFIKLFSPSSYIPLLLYSVFKVLLEVHNLLKNSEDCSLEFIAKLVGRLCIVGYADIVTKKFSKELIKLCDSDFIWRRMSQNLIGKIPSNYLDSFITNLLLTLPWYGYIEWIMGDEGAKNEKILYIMTVKLLFYRSFKQGIILQNIIGYFASSSSRVSHFINILHSLLDSWIDERALSRQSIDQKVYIASALVICSGWVEYLKLKFENKEYMNKVLIGTQIRMGSSEETVRFLGMFIGENLIKSIDPDAPPLGFEFPETDLLNQLKCLLAIPSKPVDDSVYTEDLKCFEEIEAEKSKDHASAVNMNTNVSDTTVELDSDDDLEPYDLSNDVSLNKGTKRPLYIQECMKGLLEQDNAEWAEMCLKHAEELIKANTYATEEVAEEMAKIMLHLGDSFNIPDFVVLRHRILIALTVQCPIVVTSYLISQFAEKDYTIRLRLDILEVLASSSALLSHSRHPPSISSKEGSVAKNEAEWKLVVDQRLQAKTKHFTKAQQSVLIENKLSAIAGNFFYPLLNSYERLRNILKLDEDDSYVLGRYIYTLGIIMCSASNTIHCRQIGTTLLQFLSSVKSHKDVFVRKAVIFAVAATYTSVPSSILFSEILPEVTDFNDWLQSVALNDPEGDCIEKALYTLSIFQSAASEVPLLTHV